MPGVQPPADLFDDSSFVERLRRPEEDKPKPAPKDFAAAKAAIRDARANVLGALYRPVTPGEIARFTAQLPEMEVEGMARRNDAGLWELVPPKS